MKSLQTSFASFCFALAFACPVCADFQYSDFSSIGGLTLNGTAFQSGSEIVLTNGAGQNGTFFVDDPQDITASFSASFTFTITNPVVLYGSGPNGADGLALVIQNDPRGTTADGGQGGELGIGADGANPGTAINNMFATAFRSFTTNEFQLLANGANNSYQVTPLPNDGNGVSASTSGTAFNNIVGQTLSVLLSYDAAADAVSLSVNGTPEITDYDLGEPLSSIVGASDAYVGFSGAAGGAGSTETLGSANFVTTPEPSTSVFLLSSAFVLCGFRRRRRSPAMAPQSYETLSSVS